MHRSFGLFAGLLLITAMGSGCVFPIPPAAEKPFRDVSGDWLSVGKSTIENVYAELGEPTLKGAGWSLYREPYDGWGLAFCVGGAFGGFGCEALPAKSSGQFLLVDFDSARLLTDVEILAESALCEDYRICYSGEFLMQQDTLENDSEAKNFTVPAVGCSVYTYSQTDSDLAAGELSIDGTDAGGLVGKSGFYRHSVSPGLHEWMIAPSQSATLPLPAAKTVLECAGQQIIFLRYTYGLNTLWFNKIKTIDMRRGKKDVSRRWLAISSGP